jgi:hypothetical protein
MAFSVKIYVFLVTRHPCTSPLYRCWAHRSGWHCRILQNKTAGADVFGFRQTGCAGQCFPRNIRYWSLPTAGPVKTGGRRCPPGTTAEQARQPLSPHSAITARTSEAPRNPGCSPVRQTARARFDAGPVPVGKPVVIITVKGSHRAVGVHLRHKRKLVRHPRQTHTGSLPLWLPPLTMLRTCLQRPSPSLSTDETPVSREMGMENT